MQSDEQLAAHAQQGNAEAYAELVTRYQQRLFRFLQTRCASRADAEDALQDAFVDAWRYLHSYNSRWRFSTWLYRIALRRAARQRNDATPGEQVATDPGGDPLAVCMAADERENLWRTARRLLGEDAVTALWLHSVEGMPIKDIARALQRSLPWTKVSLMRSRRRLRAALMAQEAASPESEAYG